MATYLMSVAVLFHLLFQAAAPAGTSDAPMKFNDPLITQRADPFVLKHTDGYYYFMGSVPEYDRLELRRSKTIAGLATAEAKVIWKRPAQGELGGHIWAPEIHYLDGKWYVYFAAGWSKEVFKIRTYALVNDSANPLEGEWKLGGMIKMNWDSFTLDSTVFEHKGKRYMAWAQNDPKKGPGTSIYIAEMSDPLTLKGTQVCIATPTLPWEIIGHRVNEGPAFLIKNGRVFMTFSASATDANYCMGLLTADENADLLDAKSWKKTDHPVFKTSEKTKHYGPGHNSFTVAEDGVTDLMIYHARDYKEIKGDPLYDHNRHTRVQVIQWDDHGAPVFGEPGE